MNTATIAGPVIVRAQALGSIRLEPLTCTIGAQPSNANLGVASRAPERAVGGSPQWAPEALAGAGIR